MRISDWSSDVCSSDLAQARDEDLAPAELAAHIEEKHHGYLHAELPLLVALADKVASVHGERHAELAEVARLVTTVRDDLEPHLAKEETFLFPVTQELAGGEAAGVGDAVHASVEELMVEHAALGEVLGQLRVLTDDYRIPADACASYTSLYQRLAELETDTFRHLHLANTVLFPALAPLPSRLPRAGSSA